MWQCAGYENEFEEIFRNLNNEFYLEYRTEFEIKSSYKIPNNGKNVGLHTVARNYDLSGEKMCDARRIMLIFLQRFMSYSCLVKQFKI